MDVFVFSMYNRNRCGAVKPERPWSLEHLLDIVGTVLIAYAAFKAIKKLRALGRTGVVDDAFNLKPKNLMRELANSGEKVSIDDVIAVTRTADGRLVWLETGTESAGLRHVISRHLPEFIGLGISEKEIPNVIMQAVKHGKIVKIQGTREVYEIIYNGQSVRIAITIGGNGFIVGANPSSMK